MSEAEERTVPYRHMAQNGGRCSSTSIYDVGREGEGWSRNATNLQTNNIDFADKEGRGGKKILNLSFDVIYGSG